MRKIRAGINFAICAAAILLTTGCAGTLPKADFAQSIAPDSHIAAKDDAKVKVDAISGVPILESERTRIAEKIKQKIDVRKTINNRDSAKTYEIDLVLTKYEKGNAFARAMLAGLGQIHIDGEVSVLEIPGRIPVGKFTINKTFAWGGIYGGTTSMEDIETTFADGVAAALTGQSEEPQKKTVQGSSSAAGSIKTAAQ
jgi:hypothetical protein